jgi:hypothetical protein
MHRQGANAQRHGRHEYIVLLPHVRVDAATTTQPRATPAVHQHPCDDLLEVAIANVGEVTRHELAHSAAVATRTRTYSRSCTGTCSCTGTGTGTRTGTRTRTCTTAKAC